MKKTDVKNLIKSLEADKAYAEEQIEASTSESDRQYWTGRWTALGQAATDLSKLVQTKKKTA